MHEGAQFFITLLVVRTELRVDVSEFDDGRVEFIILRYIDL